jgi:hypothetical protein
MGIIFILLVYGLEIFTGLFVSAKILIVKPKTKSSMKMFRL